MSVAIVKYNAGNVFSVQCALQRIGVEAVITDDFEALRRADKVVFPGVGEASTAMHFLREKGLDEVIKSLTQPVLGICIGLQLLCRSSEEGNVACMGVFDADIKRFRNDACPSLKIPHMGWNSLTFPGEKHPLFRYIHEGDCVYFVHSFYAAGCVRNTIALTEYGAPLTAAVARDNVMGCQFHPEKSGPVGLNILRAFWEGEGA